MDLKTLFGPAACLTLTVQPPQPPHQTHHHHNSDRSLGGRPGGGAAGSTLRQTSANAHTGMGADDEDIVRILKSLITNLQEMGVATTSNALCAATIYCLARDFPSWGLRLVTNESKAASMPLRCVPPLTNLLIIRRPALPHPHPQTAQLSTPSSGYRRIYIDFDWRQRFNLHRRTSEFEAYVQKLPPFLIALEESLPQILRSSFEHIAACFRNLEMPLPPWRSPQLLTEAYLRAHQTAIDALPLFRALFADLRSLRIWAGPPPAAPTPMPTPLHHRAADPAPPSPTCVFGTDEVTTTTANVHPSRGSFEARPCNDDSEPGSNPIIVTPAPVTEPGHVQQAPDREVVKQEGLLKSQEAGFQTAGSSTATLDEKGVSESSSATTIGPETMGLPSFMAFSSRLAPSLSPINASNTLTTAPRACAGKRAEELGSTGLQSENGLSTALPSMTSPCIHPDPSVAPRELPPAPTSGPSSPRSPERDGDVTRLSSPPTPRTTPSPTNHSSLSSSRPPNPDRNDSLGDLKGSLSSPPAPSVSPVPTLLAALDAEWNKEPLRSLSDDVLRLLEQVLPTKYVPYDVYVAQANVAPMTPMQSFAAKLASFQQPQSSDESDGYFDKVSFTSSNSVMGEAAVLSPSLLTQQLSPTPLLPFRKYLPW